MSGYEPKWPAAKEMAEKIDRVKAAEGALSDAEVALSAARSRHTAAINELNQAQKCVDEFVADIKRDAPTSSDWYDAPRRKHAAD